MASNGSTKDGPVHYGATSDPENVNVEVKSPAKNRYKEKSLNHKKKSWPILFERASGSWWNPKFDSEALEKEQWKNYFPQTRRRFQYALIYIIVACIAWCIFFGCSQQEHWILVLVGSLILCVIIGIILGFTYTRLYENFCYHTSVIVAVFLCAGILTQSFKQQSNLSTVGTFTASIEVLLLMYTVIPMPLFVAIGIGVLHSILYEILTAIQNETMQQPSFIVGKFLLHLCIHLIGIHIFIMSQVRKRSTFWKIGQSVMAQRDLQIEKQIKEKMIHSLMPPTVAKEVMQSREDKPDDEEDDGRTRKRNSRGKHVKGEIIFRPFNMSMMDNVSILFADIVGFTKMSSNKTAEHLVGLLNDLFGRFDKLCTEKGCEKISTLGDCYYCVSGCPTAKPDHAKCCVEMGLGMIKAIKEFDEDNNESVDMRVGVHTGTVLCGIVGTRRFKFDVWSNDVTLANTMESSGKPGLVHISETSYEFLKDEYDVEEGPDIQDNRTQKVLIEHYDTTTSSYSVRHKEDQKVIKTYFISGSKKRDGFDSSEDLAQNAVFDSVASNVDRETSGDGAENFSDSDGKELTDVEKGENRLSNHFDSKHTDVNGVSPAALLGRRHSSGFYATSELSLDMIGDGKSNNTESSLPTKGTKTHTECAVCVNTDKQDLSESPANTDQKEAQTANGDLKSVKDNRDPSMIPINEAWTKIRKIHEQTDLQIINCIKDDVTNKEFFYKPPINKLTLHYNNRNLEEKYQDHYLEDTHTQNTVSSPRYHGLLEIMMSFIVFFIISLCCFIIFDRELPWLIIFILSLIIEVLVFVHTLTDVQCKDKKLESCNNFVHLISGWYFRNLVGAIVASIPIVAVYSNFSCSVFEHEKLQDRFFCYCVVLSLLHYCNFTMLSSWMKSILAALAGLVLLVLLAIKICDFEDASAISMVTPITFANTSGAMGYNDTSQNLTTKVYYDHLFSGYHRLRHEVILDMLLLLFLIWFLNREFEISYRSSYHGDAQAAADKEQMQENKDQADWLLHNIIPEHVSYQLKDTSKYSKNHKDVGVIFATIVNFNEFYDESYLGGREYLRVLNELFSDYEILLDQYRFKDVEKIKTITSAFMAASGLNEQNRIKNRHQYAHLFALMEFALEMQEVVQQFNTSIFNFNFILNIGFNCGEVTAGVIGTTKLLYDIWGDTVNIASRMYSTGVKDRIQLPEAAVKILEEMFEFEYRGTIQVKGKGEMKTYLTKGKKPGAQWE